MSDIRYRRVNPRALPVPVDRLHDSTIGDARKVPPRLRNQEDAYPPDFVQRLAAFEGTIGGWELTADQFSAGNGSVVLNAVSERILLGVATEPLVGIGIFLGKDGADYEFRAGDPTGPHMHWDGSNLKITGAVITAPGSGSSPGLQGWAHDLTFSADDNDTVSWGAGTITLVDGTTFSIVTGNTGNMTATSYIFLDTAVSTTVLQVGTSAGSAVGANRILVAVAKNVADVAKDAEFVVYGGSGAAGISKTILAGVVAADTITFNELAGNTITANEISSLNLTTQSLTATVGAIGGWTLASGDLKAGSVTISSSAERILMGAATAPLTGIGIFIGKDGANYEFRAGNPAGDFIHWDGTSLNIKGTITAGTIQANVVIASGNFTAATVGIDNLLVVTGLIRANGGIDLGAIALDVLLMNKASPIRFLNSSGVFKGQASAIGNNIDATGTWNFTSTITGSITGSSGSTTGSAPAGSLTGTTLAANVVSSSLTSVGKLTSLTVGPAAGNADIIIDQGTGNTGSFTRYKRIGVNRWVTGASGGNDTNDFDFFRYNNSGVFQGTALSLRRSDGYATFEFDVEVAGKIGVGRAPGAEAIIAKETDSGVRVLRLEHTGGVVVHGIDIHFTGQSPDNNVSSFLVHHDTTTNRAINWSDGDWVNHDNSYGQTSDRKLKQDIVDAASQWDDLKAMRFRNFYFKADVLADPSTARRMLGVIAQELQLVSPELVRSRFLPGPDGEPETEATLETAYSILYLKGMVALQENMARTEALEAWNADLEARMVLLEAA